MAMQYITGADPESVAMVAPGAEAPGRVKRRSREH